MNDKIRKKAEEFMKNINEKDSVALITDHDPDGFTSGVLFYDYCIKRKAKVKQFSLTHVADGANKINLDGFNKIITTDINIKGVLPILERYNNREILFMDHHPKEADVPKGTIEYRTMYRGYIPSARSAYELCKGKKWLALVGVIIDAGFMYPENDDFIKDALCEVKMTREEFEEKVAFKIGNTILYLNEEPDKAFELIRELESYDKLDTIEPYNKPIEDEIKRIEKLFQKESENIEGVTFFYFEPKFSVKGPVINKIALKKENWKKIFIFASPNSKGLITLSARSQKGIVNMADLLKGGIGNLEGRAGGHFNASGGAINAKDLEKFKSNLRVYLQENPIPN